MMNLVAIFLGGGLGSICRFLLSSYAGSGAKNFFPFFPFGTLTVNLLGSFIIGALFELYEQTLTPQPVRSFLSVGFLGGFTTFSTFALENSNLLQNGEYKYFLSNFFISNTLSIVLVFLGIFSMRFLIKGLVR